MAITQTELKGYVAAGEAASLLGISKVSLHHQAHKGRLPCLVTPIGRLYPRTEIEAIAKARQEEKKT